MRIGETQKQLEQLLLKQGYINMLGRTYLKRSHCPSFVRDAHIVSFIEMMNVKYGIILIKPNTLYNARLELKSRK